jgi:3-methyladenine DNA glycosylase/8-oxoguanine DNA glycosylase
MDLVATPPSSQARPRYPARGNIACAPRFDFARTLDFLRGFGPMAGEQSIGGRELTKALVHEGQTILVRIRPAGTRQRHELAYELVSERPISAEAERAVARRVAFFLSADEDLTPFARLASLDPPFAPVAARLAGLHHPKFPSPFETACWGSLNQRIARNRAKAMKDTLCRRFGGAINADGREYLAFPEPATMVRAGEDAVRVALGNDRRATVVFAVARAFASVDEAFLREAPLADVEAWLLRIRGVGPFTTGFVCFRGLGRFLHHAVSPRLLAAAETIYGAPFTAAELELVSARYGAWGGMWAIYVYASAMDYHPGDGTRTAA